MATGHKWGLSSSLLSPTSESRRFPAPGHSTHGPHVQPQQERGESRAGTRPIPPASHASRPLTPLTGPTPSSLCSTPFLKAPRNTSSSREVSARAFDADTKCCRERHLVSLRQSPPRVLHSLLWRRRTSVRPPRYGYFPRYHVPPSPQETLPRRSVDKWRSVIGALSQLPTPSRHAHAVSSRPLHPDTQSWSRLSSPLWQPEPCQATSSAPTS